METEPSEQDEKGKTTASFENYDVEQAIKVVLELGEGLIKATKYAKHHFRREWLDQLVARYRGRPGKPVIHLDDMADSVMPILAPSARATVYKCWRQLGGSISSSYRWKHFRNITNFALGRNSNPARLRTWKEFAFLGGLDLTSIEPHVVSLRISEGRFTRTIGHPRLPINLATPDGAKMIGYRGDMLYSNSAFTNKDPILHLDYRRVIKSTIGDISFTETQLEGSGFAPDRYVRTNVGRFVTETLTVAGFDNTKEQKHTNNPAPSWLFLCDEDTVGSNIGAVWDTEGCVNKRDLKISQAVGLNSLLTSRGVPRWPLRIGVNALEEQCQRQVYGNPNMLIISTALLLMKLGIASHILPIGISRTNDDYSIYWQLRIIRDEYAHTFREKVRLLSKNKLQELDKCLQCTTRTSSPSLFFLSISGFRSCLGMGVRD